MTAAMERRPYPDALTFPDLFDSFASRVLPPKICDATYLRFQVLAQCASAAAGDEVASDSSKDRIVFLVRGTTKLVARASRQREQVIAFHFPGDLVPVPARAAHAYALCALEPCDLLVFPASEFLDLVYGEPRLASGILDRFLQALARCREKALILGRKTAQERVASFLVTMADRIGSPGENGCVLDLPMSRRDIADSLGLTIETISRQFGELRDASLIATSGRSIVVLLDPPALAARAGHLSPPH